MKVYVMRHGTTDWNEARRLQGNSNTSLNQKGIAITKRASEAMKDIPFTHIYSSPLGRAYETAEIIRRDRDIPIVKDDRLTEVGFGIDEGVTIEERTPGCKVFFEDPPSYVPAEGAESFESLIARTGDFIKNVIVPLSLKEPDATVFISGHGAMNKALALNFLKRDLKDFWAGAWQTNCSTAIYSVNGEDIKLLKDGVRFAESGAGKCAQSPKQDLF